MTGFSLLVAGAAFVTSVISAVFGMAGGMILMGLYAAALPVQVAMVLHGVTQLFANGFRAFLLRDRIYAPGLVWYGAGALASLLFFTWLALVVSRPVMFLVLGGIPLALSFLPPGWPRTSCTRRRRWPAGRCAPARACSPASRARPSTCSSCARSSTASR